MIVQTQEMLNLADTIKGEINRICVTKDLSEVDTMHLHASKNIDKLWQMKAKLLVEEMRKDEHTMENR